LEGEPHTGMGRMVGATDWLELAREAHAFVGAKK
jgi:hypothetical protein